MDVFAEANRQLGCEGYRLRLLACEPGPVVSSSGARLMADAWVGEPLETFDTLLVAGTPNAADQHLRSGILDWLRRQAAGSRRYGSICTGAFALAAAGLLEGRRVTTHWAVAERLAARYPKVTVEADAIQVHDGKVRTAAGVTAGLDLALALVEEDFGAPLAKQVAAHLVMYFKRLEARPSSAARVAPCQWDGRPCRHCSATLPRTRPRTMEWPSSPPGLG